MKNIVIMGAQKAGTSSLYDWLGQHPQICSNIAVKDYHFFTNEKYFERGIEHFKSFFKKNTGNQINAFGAVNYIFFSEKASQRLYEFDKKIKILIALRNPIKRAFSAYTYFKKNGEENSNSFMEAINKEKNSEFTTHEERGRFTYLEHGLYYKQLEPIYNKFDHAQVKIIFYEELFKEQEAKIQDVCYFLGIDPNFNFEFNHLNKTGSSRSKLANKLVYSDNIVKKGLRKIGLSSLISLENKTKFTYWLRKANTTSDSGPLETLSEAEYEELLPYFEEDTRNLSELLGQNLKEKWQF